MGLDLLEAEMGRAIAQLDDAINGLAAEWSEAASAGLVSQRVRIARGAIAVILARLDATERTAWAAAQERVGGA